MPETVHPDRLLKELDRMWASTAKQTAEGEDGAVLRACSMNLIVLAPGAEDPADLTNTLGEITREHPNRSILVLVRQGAGSELEAKVSVLCWMPFGQRQQICSEQIEIRCSTATFEQVPPIVGGVLAADLPVILWCRSEELLDLAGIGALRRLSRKVIVNSARFSDARGALAALRAIQARGAMASDLAWTELTPWRALVAQAFENPAHQRALKTASTLWLRCGSPVFAAYLLAWVIRSLKWRLTGGRLWSDAGAVELAIDLPARPAGAEVEFLSLGGDGWRLELSHRDGGILEIRKDGVTGCSLIPPRREEELVAEELGILGADSVFEAVLPRAAELLETGVVRVPE